MLRKQDGPNRLYRGRRRRPSVRHAVSRPGELDPNVQGPGLRVDTSAEVPKMFVDRDRARLEIVVQGHARLVSDEEPEMDLSFVRGVLDTFQLQAPEPR